MPLLHGNAVRLRGTQDPLQIGPQFNGSEARENIGFGLFMEDQQIEFMARFGLREHTDFRFFGWPLAAARVAVIGGNGRIGRQFYLFVIA